MAWADPRVVTPPELSEDGTPPPPPGVATLEVNLDDIFSLKETHHHVVTRELDYDGLQTALKWVVDKVQNINPGDAGKLSALEKQLADLMGENSALKDKLTSLEQQQVDLVQQLDSKASKDQIPSLPSTLPTDFFEDMQRVPNNVVNLEYRLSLLEEKPKTRPSAAAELTEEAEQGETVSQAREGMSPMTEQRLAALEHAVENLTASLDTLEAARAQAPPPAPEPEQREQQPVAVAAAAAEPQEPQLSQEDLDGLKSELERQLGSQLEDLQAQLAAMRSRLDEKADRSELDSMMQAGLSRQPGDLADAEPEPETYVVSEPDAPFDADAMIDAVNRTGAELRALRNRTAVLQERLKNKADISSLDDLRQQVTELMAKVRNDVKELRGEVKDVRGQGLDKLLDELTKRMNAAEREQRRLAMERERDNQDRQERDAGERALPDVAPAAGYEAAPAAEADASDHGAQIQELYQLMGAKASATDVAALIMHMRDLASKLEELRSGAVSASPRSGRQPLSEPSSPHWDRGSDRIERLEAALSTLQDALSMKADLDTLARKADTKEVIDLGNKLSGVVLDMTGKADRSVVEELRLRLALMGDRAPGEGAAVAGPDSGALVQMLQGMLERKASADDLDALRALVESKAGRDQVAALAARLDAIPPPAPPAPLPVRVERQASLRPGAAAASRDELTALATQIGDLYAELERQRRELARLPKEPPLASMLGDQGSPSKPASSSAAALSPEIIKIMSALAKELQEIKDQSEQVAHAVNLLAIGADMRVPETNSPKGAYDRLLRLLGSKAIHHKMDYFDPDVLNRMAQKVANLDSLLLKNPSMVRVGPDLGLKELESQMRKMGRELRNVKDRMADMAAAAGMPQVPPGDHAMLAGKPLQGYRCLACDRPLEKLDQVPGPHMPTQQMGAKAPLVMDKLSLRQQQPKAATSANLTPEPSARKVPYDASQRGPQQWYDGDGPGRAADMLPKEDVGPKLQPGGWSRRTSNSGTLTNGRPVSGLGLPEITQAAPWSPSAREREQQSEPAVAASSPTSLPAI